MGKKHKVELLLPKMNSGGYKRGSIKTVRGDGGMAKRLDRDEDGNIQLKEGRIIDWAAGFELMFGFNYPKVAGCTKPCREELKVSKGIGSFNYTNV